MLTVARVAAELGLHPDTIRRYEKEGRIPPARRSPFNGYRYWSPEEVEELRLRLFSAEAKAQLSRG